VKCFIAMAFGREDTDQFYDRLICPILEQRYIQPVRVDRMVHNDDIDDRILEEIKSADFCIADLSYARPSVYYEAGYAEREIPVIYTLRRDHFKPRADDEWGVFRVHFDLQMKNVIDWTDANDELFMSRFGSRVDAVIAPILRRAELDDTERLEKQAFSSLSVRDQVLEVAKTIDLFATELVGFCTARRLCEECGEDLVKGHLKTRPREQLPDNYYRSANYLRVNEEKVPKTPCSQRSNHDCFGLFAGVLRLISFTGMIRPPWDPDNPGDDLFTTGTTFNLNPKGYMDTINEIREDHIYCSTRTYSFDKIALRKSEMASVPNIRSLVYRSSLDIPSIPANLVGEVFQAGYNNFHVRHVPQGFKDYEDGAPYIWYGLIRNVECRKIPWTVFFHLIDGIQSSQDCKRRLESALNLS
jgi:hypothetical protein